MSHLSSKVYTVLAIIVFVIFFILFIMLTKQKDVNAPLDIDMGTNQSQSSPHADALKGKDEIYQNALNLYIEKKGAGVDLTNGPCLGPIGQDWVLDIVHDPRTAVDDKAQNQCKELENGTAKHFIELSIEGNLVRAI